MPKLCQEKRWWPAERPDSEPIELAWDELDRSVKAMCHTFVGTSATDLGRTLVVERKTQVCSADLPKVDTLMSPKFGTHSGL